MGYHKKMNKKPAGIWNNRKGMVYHKRIKIQKKKRRNGISQFANKISAKIWSNLKGMRFR